ncbi:MAG TPA: hypothetical protein VMT69_10420 [Kineosporiaceae bacterium]|nr:hypothetical protein [Kineosporiaceae bacterium]
MTSLTTARETLRRSHERRQRLRKLREELADYRTPAERAELEAILARHDTSVSELLHAIH